MKKRLRIRVSFLFQLIRLDEGDDAFGSDISFLYSCLHMHPLTGQLELPSCIKTAPYPHQHLALCWMLSREGHAISQEEDRIAKSNSTIHPLFVHLRDNPKYFFAPRTFYMTGIPMTSQVQRQGGVLCDMMGLGKTFEMLALILLHPRDGSVRKELEGMEELKSVDGSKELKGMEELKELKGMEELKELKGTDGIKKESKQVEGSIGELEGIACRIRKKRKHRQEQKETQIMSVKRAAPSEENTAQHPTSPQPSGTGTLRPLERSFIEFVWTHLGMSVMNWTEVVDAFNTSYASKYKHQLEVLLNMDDSYEEKPSQYSAQGWEARLLCVDLSFIPVSPTRVFSAEGCCVRGG